MNRLRQIRFLEEKKNLVVPLPCFMPKTDPKEKRKTNGGRLSFLDGTSTQATKQI